MLTRLWRRLRSDAGFGLPELLIALLLLNIGLLALLAAFVSGSNALKLASRTATAATLADQQLELYRALTYSAIALDSTAVNGTDTTYRNDAAIGGQTANLVTTSTGCSGLPAQCNPSRSVTGPDGGTYRVDTYVVYRTPTGGRPLKLVTVVVRNSASLGGLPFTRQSSSFDESTGTY